MPLPASSTPSDTVLGLTITGLSLAQVRALQAMETDEADVLAIAWSSGEDPEEVRTWFGAAPAGDVLQVLTAIFRLSGLDEGARFPG